MLPRTTLILPSFRAGNLTIYRHLRSARNTSDDGQSRTSVDTNPFIWSPRYGTQIDIEVLLRANETYAKQKDVIESTLYTVYPISILEKNRKDLVNANDNQHPLDINHKSSKTQPPSLFIPFSSDIGVISRVCTLNQRLNFPTQSITKCLGRGEINDKGLPKSSRNGPNLPTTEQLNEMMYHFQDQAPNLYTSGWTYNKCSYKVIFENQMIGTTTNTLNSYIFQINTMRKISRLFLVDPELSIIRMTKNLEDGTIHVRWQLQGIPRYIWPLSFLGHRNDPQWLKYIDGFSTFYICDDGLYHKHILMKMVPRKNPEKKSVAAMFLSRFGFIGGALEKQPVTSMRKS